MVSIFTRVTSKTERVVESVQLHTGSKQEEEQKNWANYYTCMSMKNYRPFFDQDKECTCKNCDLSVGDPPLSTYVYM